MLGMTSRFLLFEQKAPVYYMIQDKEGMLFI